MDELTTQRAADAFQAEDAEHAVAADERAELVASECFQAEDGEHTPITRPAASRASAPS